jgi:hypothetical protein
MAGRPFSRPPWQRWAVIAVVLSAPFWLPKLAFWADQNAMVRTLNAAGLHEPPIGFATQDPLDPAMRTGYRHPFYTSFIAPYDSMFPTTDPPFTAFFHQSYSLELDQYDSDRSYGWVSVELPEGIVKPAADHLRPAACRVFRAVITEPQHTGYQHLLIQLSDDTAFARFDLRRSDCGL